MNVGVCKITLHLPENQSLKGKRRVLKSLSSRIRNKFNVSIAEVEGNDSWQMAVLGITCVTNSSRHADDVITAVISYIENNKDEVEVVGREHETITGF